MTKTVNLMQSLAEATAAFNRVAIRRGGQAIFTGNVKLLPDGCAMYSLTAEGKEVCSLKISPTDDIGEVCRHIVFDYLVGVMPNC